MFDGISPRINKDVGFKDSQMKNSLKATLS